MDGNLFTKHFKQLAKQQQEKKLLINYIQEKTNILLEEQEIIISKKKISINTSSVVQSKLIQKNIKVLLQEKGYTYK